MNPVEFFKLLADETRLTTILLIRHFGELCVCELTEALQLSQPKVSRHLALLRNAGVLEGEKRGQWVYYRLSAALSEVESDLLNRAYHGYAAQLTQPLQQLAQCRPSAAVPECCSSLMQDGASDRRCC